MPEGVEQSPDEDNFDWRRVRWPSLYPSPETLAEIGRVTIAAARLDRQVAMVLLALKYRSSFADLLKQNSMELRKALKSEVERRFEGDLLQSVGKGLEEVRRRIELRHTVVHSIWTPGDSSDRISVELLRKLRNQEEVDKLLLERGASADWTAIHPKTGSPSPQTLEQLEQVRSDLEDAANWLDRLRFTLASALFAGTPSGAREVLDPRSLD